MTGLDVILASLFSNLVTRFTKPKKSDTPITEAQRKKRKTFIRGLNAFFALIVAILGTIFLGESVDGAEIQTFAITIFEAIAIFASSQGFYFLAKEQK